MVTLTKACQAVLTSTTLITMLLGGMPSEGRPIFPLEDYEVIVHELAPGYTQKQFQKPTFPLYPGGITISVQEQQLGDRASLFQNEWNEAPLCITL